MIHLDMLLAATGGTLLVSGAASNWEGFAHDSRATLAGQCFVAIRGTRGDGLDYLDDAVANGATGLLVPANGLHALEAGHGEWQDTMRARGVTVIIVDDTRAALRAYAARALAEWSPTVIAVAGSAGKTTTKEAIADVLELTGPTFRSWRNYNDLLGVPLSLGGLNRQHRYAVIELAADHPGEMAALCALIHPQMAVVTNVSATHLHYFGTMVRLEKEFATLAAALPDDGLLLLSDDPASARLSHHARARVRWLSGHSEKHTRWQVLPLGENGRDSLALADMPAATRIVTFLGFVGDHWADVIHTALALADELGVPEDEALARLRRTAPLPGRMKLLRGEQELTLIDDTHNAIPASLAAGLRAASALGRARQSPVVAVLGDMMRLGDLTEKAHRDAGILAAQSASAVIARGAQAETIIASAVTHGMPAERAVIAHTAADAAQAARRLAAQLRDEAHADPILYLKGSEEARMEQVTALLLADTTDAAQALDRQTSAWREVRFMQPDRPTWLEIDLHAIASNVRYVSRVVGPDVRILVSLKADAYGHGALRVARTALHNGAMWLGVATVSEAQALRAAGITAPILVFGYIPSWQAREAVRLDLRATIFSQELADALATAGRELGKPIQVHLKIDSGMGRLGLRAEHHEDILRLVEHMHRLDGLQVEGIFTHFATADSANLAHARTQLARFSQVLALLEERGLRPPIVHAANSAATLSLPEARFDMVRPGILIYGLAPSIETPMPNEIRPALGFKTRVAQVKRLPAGEAVSYGATWVTPQPSLIAVLPVGYADGFRRSPTNWGEVLVRGQRAPVVGRVCMDQCMIDVTGVPGVHEGDEVVLIGRQGDESISADDVAARLGTINYEVVSALLPRVPRVDPTGA